MKIVTIIGARPQFIKAAALSRVLRKKEGVQEVLLHTGQHFDANMSDVFFEQLDIPVPDYNLEIAGLHHGAMTGRMLEKIELVLLDEKPDRVLVYGDTNSTLAGVLAASKLHIPVAHVEAGLRSFNMQMPEEINRIVADRLSDKLFCPTDTAVKNLQNEGYGNVTHVEIINSGDVMQDAALFYASKAQSPELPVGCFALDDSFALVTLHRAENTNDLQRLRDIYEALAKISYELPLIMPVHPRTRKKFDDAGIDFAKAFPPDRFCLIAPVGYLEMVFLLKHCQLVLTDSGGLQKEAFFFEKPCVTLRDETEWTELVEHGANWLAGNRPQSIYKAFTTMLNRKVDSSVNLYGAGQASFTIVKYLLNE